MISFEVATCELPQPTPALVIKQPEIRFPSGKMRFFNAAQTYGELVIIPLDPKECQRLKNEFLPFNIDSCGQNGGSQNWNGLAFAPA